MSSNKWGLFKSIASTASGILASGVVSGALNAIFATAEVITGKKMSTFTKITRYAGASLVGGYVGYLVEEHTKDCLSEYDMAIQANDISDTVDYVASKEGE